MNDISHIYKYTSFRKQFFENFYLRCTPRSALNDPFELLPSQEYMAHEIANYGDFLDPEDASTPKILERLKLGNNVYSMYTRRYDRLGIISFTESNDNQVMWSHYADNHKGMVIEFDTRSSLFTNNCSLEDYRQFKQVKYQSNRPTSLGIINETISETAVQLLDDSTALFTKSNEWMYEKEHRLVCQLDALADIFCTIDFFKKNYSEQTINPRATVNQPDFVSLKGFNDLQSIVSAPEVLCMLKVPKDCIRSITCGAMMPQEDKGYVKQKADELGFSYREAVIDDNEYRLNFLG